MKKMNYPAAAGRYSSALLLIIESGLVYCVAAVSAVAAYPSRARRIVY